MYSNGTPAMDEGQKGFTGAASGGRIELNINEESFTNFYYIIHQ